MFYFKYARKNIIVKDTVIKTGLFSAIAPQHPVIEINSTKNPSTIVTIGISLEYKRTSDEKIPYKPNPIRIKPASFIIKKAI